MKLLSWMHRKLQQNSIDPFKDFARGNCCTCLSAQLSIDDDDLQTKPSFGSRDGTNPFNPTKETTFSENEITKMQEIFEEGISIINSELFHGFLTIGTLGSEPMTSDPATPTFPASLENITEKETEVTENDLKFINDELEKFLEAEAEEEQSNELLCRNSYVSTITLSGKQMEGVHADDFQKMAVCPLQGYLFESPIDLPETRSESKKEKATLGELFLKTTLTDENFIKESGKQAKPAKKTHKSAKNLITKMLKRLRVSSRSSIPCSRNNATDSVPTKKRLQKILQMFYRKVHPEHPINEGGRCAKSLEHNKTLHDSNYTNGDLTSFDEAEKSFHHGRNSKEGIQYYNNYKMTQYELSGKNSSGNRERWITTDTDYLVLEL